MDDKAARPTRLLAGDLQIDPGRHCVSRGNEELEVGGLSFHLLMALVEAAPNMLSHDEIVERVWNGRVVSPETVTQRVKLVRRALGDDAHAPRYISAVRGEGYRLLVDVEALPDVDLEDNLTRRVVAELGRRRVFQVAFVYVLLSWFTVNAIGFVNIESLSTARHNDV